MAGDSKISAANENKKSNISIIFDHPENGGPQREYTLDEAVEEARIGRYQTMLIVLTGLSIMGAAVENVNISYITPYAKCDLKLTIAEQGVLASVSFLGIVSTSYFWGFLADTWGRQKVLSVACFGGFIFSTISAFATNTYAVIVLRFLAGAMLAGAQAGAYSYISEFHTTKTAARAVAYSTVCLNGLAIPMALMGILIIPMNWTWHILGLDFKPWRLFLICNSCINLWNGIVFSILPESPKFLLTINKKEEALQVLRRVYAFNTGQPEETYPVENIKSDGVGNTLASSAGVCSVIRLLWAQTKPIFLPPLLTNTLKMCYLIFAIFAIGHGTFMWFPDFLMQLQNYSGPPKILCEVVQPKENNVNSSIDLEESCKNLDNSNILTYEILLGVGILFAIAGVLASIIMKRVSPKVIIFFWMMLSALTCFALNFLTEFNSIVTSFVLFLGCCSSANIVMPVAVNLFPTNYRGMATSFILMFGRIGGFAGSNLVGILLENMCTSIFYLNGALLLSCLFLFLTVKPAQNKPSTSNEPK